MALTFPLSLASFFDGLAFVSARFTLPEMVETNESGGGELIVADYGPRLWEIELQLRSLPRADAEALTAKIRRLFGADASFMIGPPAARQSVSDGTISGTQNGREISLAGLSAGQVVRAGSYLSFTYGSSPTRYALHQAVETATADGSGTTGFFEVVPAVRAGANNGTVVRLASPYCKAVMIPGSMSDLTIRTATAGGLAFRARQTLR